MIIKDLVESSFLTEIDTEEAKNLQGGSVVGYYWSRNPSKYRLRNEFANGVNKKSLAKFDRNLSGILSTLRYL